MNRSDSSGSRFTKTPCFTRKSAEAEARAASSSNWEVKERVSAIGGSGLESAPCWLIRRSAGGSTGPSMSGSARRSSCSCGMTDGPASGASFRIGATASPASPRPGIFSKGLQVFPVSRRTKSPGPSRCPSLSSRSWSLVKGPYSRPSRLRTTYFIRCLPILGQGQ